METALATEQRSADFSGGALKASAVALVTATWISAAIFGVYILAAYGGALQDGALERWNDVLPQLYLPTSPLAAIGIGIHFASGAVLLLLGPIQLIGAARRKAPAFHRWTGRVYVGAAFLSGVGGLTHIVLKGTTGGMLMNVGFGIYGALMVLGSVQALRHAMARRIDQHRAWAIRLFALAVGSWLYRVEYGLWQGFMGEVGHTDAFDGWFDMIMIFFFYVPNLLIAELFIRARKEQAAPMIRVGSAVALAATAALVAYSTYLFTIYAWGPPILARFS
jgi:hypothetical protein